MTPHKTKVILFQVNSPQEKIKKIIEIATKHAHEKHPLLILVESKNAADYIDNLLWNSPEYSFLPHNVITESYINPLEYISISDKENTTHSFRSVFNLKNTPPSTLDSYTTIYDFEDYTSEDRKKFFEKRYKTYLDEKLHLISL